MENPLLAEKDKQYLGQTCERFEWIVSFQQVEMDCNESYVFETILTYLGHEVDLIESLQYCW